VIFFYSKSTFLHQSDQQINEYFNTIIITPFYNYYIKYTHSCSVRTWVADVGEPVVGAC